jgi:hypothetical protein
LTLLCRCLLAAALLLAVPSVALAHDPRSDLPSRWIGDAANLPLVMSPNVRLASTFPETQGISGEFARTGNFFYMSSLDSISVFDTSDPLRPRLTGTLANLVFENEAMSYGERRKADGTLERFVLVGNDLYNFSADETGGVRRGSIGGGEVIVVDVTDPTNPHVRSTTPSTTSTHTLQCVTADCRYAYTAGEAGKFSIIDLGDLDHPVEVGTAPSTASGPTAIFTNGSGHYWDFDSAGIGWHTGSGGAAAFDVRNPANPVALNTTDAHGTQTPWNDFIHHNSMRPNATRFRANANPSVGRGNVLLVTEEDYANDGDELACDRAGTFQTWHVPSLKGSGTIAPLDIINPVKFGDGLSTPVGGFCSAHWFDYHQSGIVAQGFYQQGLRFIDVRNPRDLKQFGYVTGGATEVWDAYWVPQRDRRGVALRTKTNVVYTTDLVRGLDVYEVDVPGTDLGETDDSLLDLLP